MVGGRDYAEYDITARASARAWSADLAEAKHRDAQVALMTDAARRDHGWTLGSVPAGRTSEERGDDR